MCVLTSSRALLFKLPRQVEAPSCHQHISSLLLALGHHSFETKMSANPALVQTFNNELIPAPFANEVFVLKRPKVGFELDGVQTRNGK
jgi:hypothetical protein